MIKGVELLAIDAKRYARTMQQMQQVRIDHNSTVSVVKEASPTTASVEFRYTASYGAVGIITIEGALVWEGKPEFDAKKLTETWRASAQMPPDIASEIHTAIMRVCLPEAVGISKNLQLPPPIPLPQVKFQEQGKPPQVQGAGHGMEVV
ncbi:MAG TPA: hypothetical protein VGR28_13675 [Candidatus Thermoplasmatota archaeon]|jgi:hypothetical protein|nr:hypothetical protein [Candidatus Thermoplasmatota archaeon]